MSVTEVAAQRAARLSELSRELLRTARAWAMYPPSHPAASATIDRLHGLLSELTAAGRVRVGVTPRDLTIDDEALEAPGPVIGEAAKMLHDRDVLQLTFETRVSKAELRALFGLLKLDVATLRDRGGPGRIWRKVDSPTIGIVQLDYHKMMECTGSVEGPVTRDDRWRAIVRSLLDRRTLDVGSQQQVLHIAHDPTAFEALIDDVQAPMRAADGSPIVTAQAAAVLNAYQQVAEIVAVRAPDAERAMLRTVAEVSQRLSPSVVAELLRLDEDLDDSEASSIGSRLVATMDETSLGGLLADVATKHRASTDRIGRIVQLLDGSARKHAVLVEARTALSRRFEDQPERLAELWSSIEQVATASDATQYTPTAYGSQLGHVGERAVVMQGDLPPELEAWMNTLGADRIRDLTLTLLLDLLALDPTDAQADGIIADLGEAAEDLLAAGDHEAVLTIVERLTATHGTRAIGHRAAAGSLQRLATGTALQEASLLLDAMPADGYDHFRRICVALGPSAVDALRQYLTVARPDSGRLVEILQALGDAAIARLAPVVHHPDPETHVRLARLLGRVGSAACVPLLETLARGGNRQVSAEATRNLLAIGDPRSAGLVREILRTSNAERRSAILAAIAAGEAADSAPLLVQVLSDCDALRDDHALALDLLGSLRQLGDRRALAGVARLMQRRSWLRPRRSRALRRHTIETLLALPGSSGFQTVTDVVHNGDRQLRRLARAALQRVEDAAPTGAEETT